MYYLSIDNVVLKSQYTGIEIVHDDSLAQLQLSIDENKKLLVASYPSGTTYRDLEQIAIVKSWVNEDNLAEIPEGIYVLYKTVDINGFKFAVSDISALSGFNQYVLDDVFIDEIKFEYDAVVIKIKPMRVDDYINFINSSGFFYVVDTDNPFVATTYGIHFNRANKIDVRCKKTDLNKDHLLIEESDYIAALILKLQEMYPEVQFYNSDDAYNDTKYNEFVKYKSSQANYDSDPITTILMSDPIYGEIIRTTCEIEFEYHTADLLLFNRRRFDYQINRFLSQVTTGELKFPNTDRKMSFTVHWDRNATSGTNQLERGTSMNEGNKWHYYFSSTIKLIVTIYRLASEWYIINRVIIKDPIKIMKVIT